MSTAIECVGNDVQSSKRSKADTEATATAVETMPAMEAAVCSMTWYAIVRYHKNKWNESKGPLVTKVGAYRRMLCFGETVAPPVAYLMGQLARSPENILGTPFNFLVKSLDGNIKSPSCVCCGGKTRGKISLNPHHVILLFDESMLAGFACVVGDKVPKDAVSVFSRGIDAHSRTPVHRWSSISPWLDTRRKENPTPYAEAAKP